MSAEALPLTLLILLAELAIGSLWVLLLAQARGYLAHSFLKFGAWSVLVISGLAYWAAAQTHVGHDVDGYPLDPSYMPEARAALLALFLLTLPYAALTLRKSSLPTLVAGCAAALAGLAALGFLAQVVAPPTWGYAGALLSLAAGALVVGAVSMGMVLGHWYLVTPRLPEQPLTEMTGFLLLAMAVQALLIVPALALPRDAFASSVETPILQNPFFWLRIGGGLAFPMLLAYMAYDSSRIRAMQSATGLLYIAMALVLSGEVLALGLLFVSAVPS